MHSQIFPCSGFQGERGSPGKKGLAGTQGKKVNLKIHSASMEFSSIPLDSPAVECLKYQVTFSFVFHRVLWVVKDLGERWALKEKG